MNEIEQRFYDAFIDESVNPDNILDCSLEIKEQVEVGPYRIDFLINDKYAIEIDGHGYHSTKEQRSNDYCRERYLIKCGFIVIRYMATEIFMHSHRCAQEVIYIVIDLTVKQEVEAFESYKRIVERRCPHG